MKLDDIFDIIIATVCILISIPFFMKYAINPWNDFGGFNTEIEKTALVTQGTLEDNNFHLKGADAYLSLAISDKYQPNPQSVRFYKSGVTINENVNPDTGSVLNQNPDDKLTDATDNYYQVYYSTQKSPSTVLNKMSVGGKIIFYTRYQLDSNIELLLHPETDASRSGELSWNFALNKEALSSVDRDKFNKHNWLYLN